MIRTVYVSCAKKLHFKRLLPDVQPVPGRRTLARFASDTFLVKTQLQAHMDEDTLTHIPRSTEPTPAAPPGPSSTHNQGLLVEQKRDQRNAPVTVISRPVPEQITLVQLQGSVGEALDLQLVFRVTRPWQCRCYAVFNFCSS